MGAAPPARCSDYAAVKADPALASQCDEYYRSGQDIASYADPALLKLALDIIVFVIARA